MFDRLFTVASLKRTMTKSPMAQACLLYRWSEGKLFSLQPSEQAKSRLSTCGFRNRREFHQAVRLVYQEWPNANHPILSSVSTVDGKELFQWVQNPFVLADWHAVMIHVSCYITKNQFICEKLRSVLTHGQFGLLRSAIEKSQNGLSQNGMHPIRFHLFQEQFDEEYIKELLIVLAKFEIIKRGGLNPHGFDGSVWYVQEYVFDAITSTSITLQDSIN